MPREARPGSSLGDIRTDLLGVHTPGECNGSDAGVAEHLHLQVRRQVQEWEGLRRPPCGDHPVKLGWAVDPRMTDAEPRASNSSIERG